MLLLLTEREMMAAACGKLAIQTFSGLYGTCPLYIYGSYLWLISVLGAFFDVRICRGCIYGCQKAYRNSGPYRPIFTGLLIWPAITSRVYRHLEKEERLRDVLSGMTPNELVSMGKTISVRRCEIASLVLA
jgi:hypothetical protein